VAKATKTVQHALSYQPQHAVWFAATHTLYNRVVAFYFAVINAHEGFLELSNKEALTALEQLTHATTDHPTPILPLTEIADNIPALFRRAAIHAALGSAYKAWNAGMITSRVNPRNTSRECARCHAPIIRYAQGMPQEGYTVGVPLMVCPSCGKRDNADRNASIVIGQRLMSRYQEKPHTLQEDRKLSGTRITQDAEKQQRPSIAVVGQGDPCGHGTAHENACRMDTAFSSIPTQLRLFTE